MEITREFLENQMAAFNQQMIEFQTAADKAAGGIQVCKHLLEMLEMEEPEEGEEGKLDPESEERLKAFLPEGAEIEEVEVPGGGEEEHSIER